jgi:hypothetical protein
MKRMRSLLSIRATPACCEATKGLAFNPIRYLRAISRYASTPSDFLLQPLRRAVSNDHRAEIWAGPVRNQDSLGSDPRRVRDRAHGHLGRDTMDGLAARLPAPALDIMRRRPITSAFGI